jgi:hypothetical protein
LNTIDCIHEKTTAFAPIPMASEPAMTAATSGIRAIDRTA